MRERLREFLEAVRRGAPLTKQIVWKGFGVLAIIVLLVGIISAPFYTPSITNPWYRGFAWFFIICLMLIVAYAIGLWPYRGLREMMGDVERERDELIGKLNKLNDLEKLREQQLGNERDWLHLIVEHIDLDKRLDTSEKEIDVKFQIDSGLVYDFRPYKLWVSPILGGYEPREPQYEMRRTPNLSRGKRSQLASKVIAVKDDKLLDIISGAREGQHVSKALKVEVQPTSKQDIFVLRSETYY